MNLRIAKLSVATLLAFPLTASASEPLCAFVTGDVGAEAYAAVAAVTVVPDSEFEARTLDLFVDDTDLTLLGIDLVLPGLFQPAEDLVVFVPGTSLIGGLFADLDLDLDLDLTTCVIGGVQTPAIPITVPQSALSTPAFAGTTPSLSLDVLDEEFTIHGISFAHGGNTFILPGREFVIPGQEVCVPGGALIVDLDVDVVAHALVVLGAPIPHGATTDYDRPDTGGPLHPFPSDNLYYNPNGRGFAIGR